MSMHTPPNPIRRAFTLLEMMVAVAAVTLLAVGISAIFRATGDTVKAGRRLNNLNTYAGLLETQIRRDIGSMTRDGFLLIRNQYANLGQPVSLLSDPPAGNRQRRIDELLFFAKGDFVSLRDPIHPARTARANAARIYYGHGLQRDPLNARDYYAPPAIDDPNDRPILLRHLLGEATQGSPNRFASDWILLRSLCLLKQPGGAEANAFPVVAGSEPAASEIFDSKLQIGLQPAAASVFQLLNERDFVAPYVATLTNADLVRDEGLLFPKFSSGIVDIATTDLTEVRAIVLGYPDPATMNASDIPADVPTSFTGGITAQNLQHAWMREALPTDSEAGYRIRCEPGPPDLLGIIYPQVPGAANVHPQTPYERTDQVMLSASNLVPRCTEFIVEWSFGDRGINGDVNWHGRERITNATTGYAAARPYPFVQGTAVLAAPFNQKHARPNGQMALWPVAQGLIHGAFTTPLPDDQVLDSYFGYFDPTYVPGGTNDPTSLPWAWPALLRITISIADPQDPTVEHTFQFIVETPGNTDPNHQN